MQYEEFGCSQGERIPRRSITEPIRRRVREKEKYHNRHCTKLWWFENPLGERFVFGSFVPDRDSLIVTVAAFVMHVGWLSQ
jgi:hypothetical protein